MKKERFYFIANNLRLEREELINQVKDIDSIRTNKINPIYSKSFDTSDTTADTMIKLLELKERLKVLDDAFLTFRMLIERIYYMNEYVHKLGTNEHGYRMVREAFFGYKEPLYKRYNSKVRASQEQLYVDCLIECFKIHNINYFK